MRTKIVTLGLAVVVAASSVYAFGGSKFFGDCDRGMGKKQFMHTSSNSNSGMKDVMMTLSDMDLTRDQWRNIRKVMFDLKEQRFDSFDENKVVVLDKKGNFDKEGFIQERTSISKDMINAQAKSIEKILGILNAKQKKILADKIAI